MANHKSQKTHYRALTLGEEIFNSITQKFFLRKK